MYDVPVKQQHYIQVILSTEYSQSKTNNLEPPICTHKNHAQAGDTPSMHSWKGIPVICLDHLSNKIQRSHHKICFGIVPLKDDLPIFYAISSGSNSFFCPLFNPALKAAWRHISGKKNAKKYMPKNATNN
jgi:hypothetical protein